MFLPGNTPYLKYGEHSTVTVYYMDMELWTKWLEREEFLHMEALVASMT